MFPPHPPQKHPPAEPQGGPVYLSKYVKLHCLSEKWS